MMLNLHKNLGLGTLVVLAITFVLFIVALFVKGVTNDLLLEAAVFLVSMKLIIMGYRNSQGVETIQQKLDVILTEEKHLEKITLGASGGQVIAIERELATEITCLRCWRAVIMTARCRGRGRGRGAAASSPCVP